MVELTEENIEQDIVFFFGAGASVDAGVPDTYRFVEDFRSFIEENDSGLSKQLRGILEIREQYNERIGVERKQVDVEQLLETISCLIGRDKEVLLDFYAEKVFSKNIAEDPQTLQNLKRKLEDFIRERVIVREEKKLEYLKELLKFKPPLEIFSLNYDTCIEQLSHVNHRRYTDGFDTYWNKANFKEDFEIKHFKMHGSVIWYENKKTKEIVKIPVRAFIEGKPTELQLIYGESVKPLLVYPAQKTEYVEPLTELQVMFKERLVSKKTKILVMVGYSFRDEYIIHMLWDAGRTNADLHIVLVSPNAQMHLQKLRFIDKDKKDPSRICDRVVCLPYPFSTVIHRLKNDYLQTLSNVVRTEKQYVREEKEGGEPDWESLLRLCIECEFSMKAEYILNEKLRKRWSELWFTGWSPQQAMLFGIKAMLHSIIAKDDFVDKWVGRVNKKLNFLSTKNLRVSRINAKGFMLNVTLNEDSFNFDTIVNKWVAPILKERNDKLKLLTPKFERNLDRTKESFKRLENFRTYLVMFRGFITWQRYFEMRGRVRKVGSIKGILGNHPFETRKMKGFVLGIEREKLRKIFEAENFQFRI